MNIWNELVEIKNRFDPKKKENITDEEINIHKHADMLLNQYITAGGKEIMGHECISFINKHK